MAPFEWITPERVMKSWGVLVGLGFLGAGIGNVYLGIVFFDDVVLFGMNPFILAGMLHLVAGVLALINEYKFRPRLSSGEPD